MKAIPRQLAAARSLLARAACAPLLVLAAVLAPPPSAAAAAAAPCAGSDGQPCPYGAVSLIGPRAEGALRFPEAVAVDGAGNVYVADQLSYVVQKFSASGAFETEWGSYGGAHGQFGPIGGLATDAAGDVYVVDSSHNRIEKFDPNGNFLTSWGHHGSALGAFSFGSSQNYTQPPGGGVAVAGGYVYVADSGNDRVERFNLNGGEALAWGALGAGPGQFRYPRGVAANGTEVIVSDDDNHRLEKFDPNGVFQGQAGSQGAGPGQFAFPYGVALDAAGNAYVADDTNHRVVKLGPSLEFAGSWGGLGAKPGQLAFPRALAADAAGDTYVADTANDRVEVFDPTGHYLRTIGASAHAGGLLTAPRGLGLDPTGRLLVADTVGNRIELFAPGTEAYEGEWTQAAGRRASLFQPTGIVADPRGAVDVLDAGNERLVRLWGDGTPLSELAGPGSPAATPLGGALSLALAAGPDTSYVADTAHNRILVFGPEGALLGRWGAAGGSGAPGRGTGEFNRPSAVAVDPAGNVYVADTSNDRVVKLSSAGAVLGQWGSAGAGNGQFHSPTGVAVDAAGRVYVVDSSNDRVEVFDPGGRFLATWGVRGTAPGEFSLPTAVGVDCNGSVYVLDTNSNRVERFDPVSPAPYGCLAPSAWPPPLDVAPVLHISLARRGGVLARRALVLEVSCARACKVLASATLTVRGARRGVPLIATARPLPAGLAGRVRLRVGPRGLRRLRRALGRHSAMTARVTIVAAGPTGRRTALTRLYAVAR